MIDRHNFHYENSFDPVFSEINRNIISMKLLIAEARLRLTLRAGFDPNQPRDDQGRWSDTGAEAPFDGTNSARVRRITLVDEEAAGGHTISKHVAKSPEVLTGYVRMSIEADPDPSRHSIRSGSFSSLEAAEKLINATLQRNRDIVAGVAQGTLSEQRVDAYFNSVTGIEAYSSSIRKQPSIRNTYGVGVYIRRDSRSGSGFRVITAYPRNDD